MLTIKKQTHYNVGFASTLALWCKGFMVYMVEMRKLHLIIIFIHYSSELTSLKYGIESLGLHLELISVRRKVHMCARVRTCECAT